MFLLRTGGAKRPVPTTDYVEECLSHMQTKAPTESVIFAVDGFNYINSIIYDYQNIKRNKVNGKLIYPDMIKKNYAIKYKVMEDRAIFDTDVAYIRDFYPKDSKILELEGSEDEEIKGGDLAVVSEQLLGKLQKHSQKSKLVCVFKRVDKTDFSGVSLPYIITSTTISNNEEKNETDDITCVVLTYIKYASFAMSHDWYRNLFRKRKINDITWELYNMDTPKLVECLTGSVLKHTMKEDKITVHIDTSALDVLDKYLDEHRKSFLIQVDPNLNADKIAASPIAPNYDYFINPIYISFNSKNHLNVNYNFYYTYTLIYHIINKLVDEYRSSTEYETFAAFLDNYPTYDSLEGRVVALLLLSHVKLARKIDECISQRNE